MSKSKCGSCTGSTGYTYTCECAGTSASVDLSTLTYLFFPLASNFIPNSNLVLDTILGVNASVGTICCQAGNDTSPNVQCGSYEAM